MCSDESALSWKPSCRVSRRLDEAGLYKLEDKIARLMGLHTEWLIVKIVHAALPKTRGLMMHHRDY